MKRLLLVIPLLLLFVACGREEVVEIDLGDVLKQADKNIAAAEAKYAGEWVVFDAEVTDIKKDSVKLVPDSLFNVAKMSGVDCKIRSGEKETLQTLSPGDSISMKGNVDKINEFLGINTIKMKSCSIIPTDD